MKAPAGIESITLAEKEIGCGGAYPPHGFKPFWEAGLGNGDYFGLYWPYGRESIDPIVCDMMHDCWSLAPAFSSLAVFQEWLDANEGMRGDIEVEDSKLVPRRFERTRLLLRDEPNQAVTMLRGICEDFPESAEYCLCLASQLRRIGDDSGCVATAIRAMASNWAFGMPSQGILRLLQSGQQMNEFADDPLVIHSSRLTTSFGGTKENENYALLKACISAYLQSDKPVTGLLLNQNYAYVMSMETVSFRERNGFDFKLWMEEHIALCAKYLGDSRTEIT